MNLHLLVREHFERASADLRSRGALSAGLAVCGLQDAVEVCLVSVAGVVGAGIRPTLDAQWDAIEQTDVQRRNLPRRAQMQALNKARVAFKHYGVLPDRSAAEAFRSDTDAFLAETFQEYFRVDFSAISEVDVVVNAAVRRSLIDARIAADAGRLEDALKYCAYALHAVREQQIPLYQTGIRVGFLGAPHDVQSYVSMVAENLRDQVVAVREIALGAMFGLNMIELRMMESVLPTLRGDQYFWPDPGRAMNLKTVNRCIQLLTRYAISVERYWDTAAHPDWEST